MTDLVDQHITHSEILLGACLNSDRKRLVQLLIASGVQEPDIHPLRVGLFRALQKVLRDPALVPTEQVVWAASERSVEMKLLTELATQYGTIPVEVGLASAKLIRGFARHSENLQIAVEFMTAARDSKDPLETRREFVKKISRVSSHSVAIGSPKEITERIRRMSGADTLLPTPTNNMWLDSQLKGGVRRRRHMAIGGAEKNRKSTWARNVALGLVREFIYIEQNEPPAWRPRQGVSVVMLQFENDQAITGMEFITMLAAENLRNMGPKEWMQVVGEIPRNGWLDAEVILDAIISRKINRWEKVLQQVIEQAMKQYESLSLYILDRTPEGGNLRTSEELDIAVRAHRVVNAKPEDLVVYVLDHMHLVKVPRTKDKFAAADAVVAQMQSYPDELDCSVITVAQLNRQTKTAKSKDKDAVVGTSGTSELEWAVQNYMTTAYDQNYPDALKVKMARSRRGGSNMEQIFRIHAESGLILL